MDDRDSVTIYVVPIRQSLNPKNMRLEMNYQHVD